LQGAQEEVGAQGVQEQELGCGDFCHELLDEFDLLEGLPVLAEDKV
jgi:hypothetical protein